MVRPPRKPAHALFGVGATFPTPIRPTRSLAFPGPRNYFCIFLEIALALWFLGGYECFIHRRLT
jgi:hypothetical protein